MRKLNGNELPLVLCLHWFYQGQEALENNKFILQEIDPGEILVGFSQQTGALVSLQ